MELEELRKQAMFTRYRHKHTVSCGSEDKLLRIDGNVAHVETKESIFGWQYEEARCGVLLLRNGVGGCFVNTAFTVALLSYASQTGFMYIQGSSNIYDYD